jgi:hypothetical protein
VTNPNRRTETSGTQADILPDLRVIEYTYRLIEASRTVHHVASLDDRRRYARVQSFPQLLGCGWCKYWISSKLLNNWNLEASAQESCHAAKAPVASCRESLERLVAAVTARPMDTSQLALQAVCSVAMTTISPLSGRFSLYTLRL